MFRDVHKGSRAAQVSRGGRNCRRSILEQFGLRRYCAGGWRWGGGVITLQGGAQSSRRPDTVRDYRFDYEVHEGRMQTGRRTAYAGSRLKLLTIQKGPAWKASFPVILGKTRRAE
jgi:hypothetical protein